MTVGDTTASATGETRIQTADAAFEQDTPGDWTTNPTNAKAALDELAARSDGGIDVIFSPTEPSDVPDGTFWWDTVP